jgi:hypothetical protein
MVMGRKQTEETKKKISFALQKREVRYCSCGNKLKWNNQSGICFKCRKPSQTRAEAVTKCRQKRKRDLVEYKGGKCIDCGYKKCIGALEFHHRDSGEKDYSIGHGTPHSWEDDIKEVDKCDLLCANCHRERHWKTFPLGVVGERNSL